MALEAMYPACEGEPSPARETRQWSSPLPRNALRNTLGFACLVLTGFAIFLGRTTPRSVPARHGTSPRYHPVNLTFSTRTRAVLLDTETGAVVARPSSSPDRIIAYSSCSPWQDDSNRSQIVATWRESGTSTWGDSGGCGLARFSFPDNVMLDRIPCWPVPASPAAWLPGRSARILFAASNGDLYRCDLEVVDGLPLVARERTALPLPLGWACPRPGGRTSHFFDIHCPLGMPGGTWVISTVFGREFAPDPSSTVTLRRTLMLSGAAETPSFSRASGRSWPPRYAAALR
jgi:hypothetical protein